MLTPIDSTIAVHFRPLFVQWTGDYREGYERLSRGGEENYYAQRDSVMGMSEMVRPCEQVGVLCCFADSTYDQVLENGVRAIGLKNPSNKTMIANVLEAINRFAPTHLILTTPQIAILQWGLRQNIHVLPLFADTFFLKVENVWWLRRLARSWKHHLHCWQLARMLNDARIRWVSNHNRNACQNLVDMGVSPVKVVPWDWPPQVLPSQHPPKTIPPVKSTWNLVFVGAVIPGKGVGDLIDAAAELRRQGRKFDVQILGGGEVEAFQKQAQDRNVADAVHFQGRQSHPKVLAAMRGADLLIVPSRHDYSEGLPMTIYEGLAVRTPLICSDHPAFRGRIGENLCSLIFPQQNPAALAECISKLMEDPELYGKMSHATAETWKRMQGPLHRQEIINRWLNARPADDQFLSSFSLANTPTAPG